MRSRLLEATTVMENGFCRLEAQVPKPIMVLLQGGLALRYREKTIEQAIVQKLARYVSGLNAIDVLLLNGFVQEESVLKRTLDELGESVMFLSAALTSGLTDLHQRYLESFWREEFEDDVLPIDSKKAGIKFGVTN